MHAIAYVRREQTTQLMGLGMEITTLIKLLIAVIAASNVVAVPLLAWAGRILTRVESNQMRQGDDIERIKETDRDHEERIRLIERRRMNGKTPVPDHP